MGFSKLYHLRDSLSGQNWEQISDKHELICFIALGVLRLESAECNSFSVVWATSASVDEGRVKSMHVVVLVVDEETLTDSRVSVSKCIHIEPNAENKNQESELI